MRTPVKEGQRSPIRSPAAQSPSHKAKAHTEKSLPGKGQRSRSPPRELESPEHEKKGDGGYDDDFEEATQDNLSSLEEEHQHGK